MRFVSLFAGIGGLDLGLERAGHECVGQVEIDDYATRVLEKHWPSVPRIRDVRDFHGTEFGAFDMLVGGYPCQPFSVAGSRKGVQDERHLWPHVHRIIRNVRPRLALLENVPGHLSLGFERVLGDLAESGYDAEWDCIPAAAVGAPHLRYRIFLLAYPNKSRPGVGVSDCVSECVRDGNGNSAESSTGWEEQQLGVGSSGEVADADCSHCARDRSASRIPKEFARLGSASWWETEPDVGRVANGIPYRAHRLRALGNAVVPQVAEYIGHLIKESEHALPS